MYPVVQLTLRVLHLADQHGDEVFPLRWLQLFAVPDNQIAQVFQKWPHEAILFVRAAFFAPLDNQRQSVVDAERLDEAIIKCCVTF